MDDINKIITINESNILIGGIEKIVFVMPPVWHRKGFFRFFSFVDYHYANIIFKDGTNYFLTSLLAQSVEEVFKNMNSITKEKKLTIIASIYLNRLLS